MDPQIAFQTVRKDFPFEGYIKYDESYINIAQTVLKWLRPGAKIMDFGAGPCDKTAILSLLGFECTACDNLQDNWHRMKDNRDRILQFAEKFGIQYKVIKEKQIPLEKGKFDMVMMHDVLEHLHDSPRDLLNDLLELAKPAGLLFLTVPNAVNLRKRIAVVFGKTNLPRFEGYYWYPGSWRGHIREYVKDDLIKLTNYLNLDTLELRSCHHTIRALPFGARQLFCAVTNVFTGWRDSWMLVAKKKKAWEPKRSLPKDELNRILERFTTYQY